tara:strand:- start:491 stop:1777 length:1287 start_codon:yes stop_codon:yes gene_type:complete
MAVGFEVKNTDGDVILSTQDDNQYMWIETYTSGGTEYKAHGTANVTEAGSGQTYDLTQTITGLPSNLTSGDGWYDNLVFIHIPGGTGTIVAQGNTSAPPNHYFGSLLNPEYAGGCMVVGTTLHGAQSGSDKVKWFSPKIMSFFNGANNKVVRSVSVVNGGSGYPSAPAIGFAAPSNGTKAEATATISNGVVTAVTITNEGFGYTASPSVWTGSPASWAAGTNYFSANTRVTNGNHRYYNTTTGTSGSTAPTHTSGTASDGQLTWQFEGTNATLTSFADYPYGINVWNASGAPAPGAAATNLVWSSVAQGQIDIVTVGPWSSVNKYLDFTFTDGAEYYVLTNVGTMLKSGGSSSWGNKWFFLTGYEFYYGTNGREGTNLRIRLLNKGNVGGSGNSPMGGAIQSGPSTTGTYAWFEGLGRSYYMIAKRRG